MLFLAEVVHDGAHCPGYNREALEGMVESVRNREEIAKEFGVTLRGWYSALPEHREFVLIEADSAAQTAGCLRGLFSVEQAEINLTVLTDVDEMLALGEKLLGSS